MRGIIACVFLLGVIINTNGCSTQPKHSTRGNDPVVDLAGAVLAAVRGKTTEPGLIPSTGGGKEVAATIPDTQISTTSGGDSINIEENAGPRDSVSAVVELFTDPIVVGGISAFQTIANPVIADPTDSANVVSTAVDLKNGPANVKIKVSDSSTGHIMDTAAIGLIPVSNNNPDNFDEVSEVVQDSALVVLHGWSSEQETLADKPKELEHFESIVGVPDIEQFEPADTDKTEHLSSDESQSALDDHDSSPESIDEPGEAVISANLNQCYPVDMFGPLPDDEQSRAMSLIITMTAHVVWFSLLFKLEPDQVNTLVSKFGCGGQIDFALFTFIGLHEWNQRLLSTLSSIGKSFCVDSGTYEKIKNEQYELDINGNVHLEDGENAPVNVREWIKHIDAISENIIKIPLPAALTKACMPLPVVLNVLRERLDCVTARIINARVNIPSEIFRFQLDPSVLGIIRGIDADGTIAEINEIKLNVDQLFRDMIQRIAGIVDRARRHPFADENRPFSYTIKDDALAQMITNDADITFTKVKWAPGLYSNLISLVNGFRDAAPPNNAYNSFPNQLLRWGADHLQNPGSYDTHMLLAYAVYNYVMEDVVRRYGEGAGLDVLGPIPYFPKPPTRNQFVGILEKLSDGIQKLIDGTLPLVANEDDPFATIIANGDMEVARDKLTAVFSGVA